MIKEKTIMDFNLKDWKNFSIYLTLIGLLIIFIIGEVKMGLGFVLIGIILMAIFLGPKHIKILKKSNW